MKAHVGVDAGSGYVTRVTATAANVHDIVETAKLIRPDDEVVYGDSGYLGIEKRAEIQTDEHLSQIDYRINRRPGQAYRKYADAGQTWEKKIERQKSSVRSKVEHPFRFVKVQCGFRKTVYRGIKKNLNRLHVLFASANLYACVRAETAKLIRPDDEVVYGDSGYLGIEKRAEIQTDEHLSQIDCFLYTSDAADDL